MHCVSLDGSLQPRLTEPPQSRWTHRSQSLDGPPHAQVMHCVSLDGDPPVDRALRKLARETNGRFSQVCFERLGCILRLSPDGARIGLAGIGRGSERGDATPKPQHAGSTNSCYESSRARPTAASRRSKHAFFFTRIPIRSRSKKRKPSSFLLSVLQAS